MNRWVLKSGAIASSTVAVCSSINASAIGTAQANAELATSQPPELATSELANQAPSSEQITPQIQSAPDAFLFDALGIESRGLPVNIEKTYSNLLKQAQAMAEHGQFTEALATTAGVPKNSQSYSLAQQLQEDWSQELLQQAVGNCQKGQVTTAIAMLNIIPAESEQHDRATELRDRWQRQASALNQAISAKQSADWQKVVDSLKLIEGTPLYQSSPVQSLLEQSIQKLYSPDQSLVGLASDSESDPVKEIGFATTPISAQTPSAISSQSEPAPLPMNLRQAIALAQPSQIVAELPPVAKTNISSSFSKRVPVALPQVPIQISKQLDASGQEPPITSRSNRLRMRSQEIVKSKTIYR
jgi:aerobic-type carbon monoxide dehydrogenase small subunit (CoxS/CutS family)